MWNIPGPPVQNCKWISTHPQSPVTWSSRPLNQEHQACPSIPYSHICKFQMSQVAVRSAPPIAAMNAASAPASQTWNRANKRSKQCGNHAIMQIKPLFSDGIMKVTRKNDSKQGLYGQKRLRRLRRLRLPFSKHDCRCPCPFHCDPLTSQASGNMEAMETCASRVAKSFRPRYCRWGVAWIW